VRRTFAVLSLLIATMTACVPKPAGHDEHLTVGDGTVTVHVPATHGPRGVVVLHSLNHNPSEMIAQGWSTSSDAHGFVAIYPDRGISWDAGLCCGTAATLRGHEKVPTGGQN
jgi:poly(3-hydroxybutyrate) depolymerase